MNARTIYLMRAAMIVRMFRDPRVRTLCPKCKATVRAGSLAFAVGGRMSGPPPVRFTDGHKVTALECEDCGFARVVGIKEPHR